MFKLTRLVTLAPGTDEAARVVRLRASGREARGRGQAQATVHKIVLRTGLAGGKMVYLDGKGTVNPTIKGKVGDTVEITITSGEGAQHDIVVDELKVKSAMFDGILCSPRPPPGRTLRADPRRGSAAGQNSTRNPSWPDRGT